MLTYQYTGMPFDTSHWDPTFGPPPTQMTARIQVARPFPEDENFVGGWIGGVTTGALSGIISASISDGVRTFTPDVVFLSGYGTNIREWLIGGGFPTDLGASDVRNVASANISARGQVLVGDLARFEVSNPAGENKTSVRTGAAGQWTAM
ncbi:MAG TPA: hypothetical protein VKB79_21110 [Bryobacteraceae bacterium]|nr:hypothetical protein [Bryobacteraceae bacterium]